jgi:hypothetical protein
MIRVEGNLGENFNEHPIVNLITVDELGTT